MIYKGSLSDKYLTPLARIGKTAINHQRARCNNKSHSYYKYYGAKGIKVEYSTREFIGWFIENYLNYSGKNPTVGRIDHSKNYNLDNICIESREDNTREMAIRTGHDHKKKKIKVINLKTNKTIKTCKSIIEASKFAGVSVITVSRHINGHVKSYYMKFTFEEA